MPRPNRIYSNIYPYHVSARCLNKEWFALPMEVVWNIFSNHLYFCNHAFEAKIHSFVLMSNHFHLILSTPQLNISKIMQYLMLETSREITSQSHRINQTYGGPYYSSIIKEDLYYQHAYKYVYRNPVDAGLVSKAEDYKYSTLSHILGKSWGCIPIISDDLLFPDVTACLDWINTPYKEENRKDIRKALSKQTFKLPRNSNTKRKNILETERV